MGGRKERVLRPEGPLGLGGEPVHASENQTFYGSYAQAADRRVYILECSLLNADLYEPRALLTVRTRVQFV